MCKSSAAGLRLDAALRNLPGFLSRRRVQKDHEAAARDIRRHLRQELVACDHCNGGIGAIVLLQFLGSAISRPVVLAQDVPVADD